MANIKLNPVFESVSGSLGKIVFYRRWRQQYARVYVKPTNPDTAAQRANRNLFAEAMKSWQLLSEEEKERYRKKARRLPMYGHNLFISEYMKTHSTARDGVTTAVSEHLQTGDRLHSSFIQRASRSVTAPYMAGNSLYLGSECINNNYG